VENVQVKSARYLLKSFTTQLYQGSGYESNFYRPLQKISFQANYALGKLKPFDYHLTNTLLHFFNAILVLLLIYQISQNRKISLITALLFAVHPIHTQAVTYISGRADPLAGLFMLLSFWLFIKHYQYRDRRRNYLLGGAVFSFFLALLSKESALILPFLLLLYDFCFPDKKTRILTRLKEDHSPFFIILVTYTVLRLTILKFPSPSASLTPPNLYLRLLTMNQAILIYLRLLLLPLDLHLERMLPWAKSFFQPSILWSSLFVGGILFLLIKSYKHSKLICFSLGWFLLTLLPVSQIVPLNAVMAEHWLYLPSLGFFLILAIGIRKISSINASVPASRNLLIGLLVLVLGFYSVLTIQRNRDWKDELTLYQHTLSYSPQSARVHNNLGLVYVRGKRYPLAIYEFTEALRLKKDYAEAYNNLGMVYTYQGKYGQAIQQYRKALQIAPYSASAYNNLGSVYIFQKEYGQAINCYYKVLELNPEHADAYNNLGAIYTFQGNYRQAIPQYKKAINLNPDCADAYKNLGIVYLAMKEYPLAREYLSKAGELGAPVKEYLDKLK